jgi:hypothetical protein
MVGGYPYASNGTPTCWRRTARTFSTSCGASTRTAWADPTRTPATHPPSGRSTGCPADRCCTSPQVGRVLAGIAAPTRTPNPCPTGSTHLATGPWPGWPSVRFRSEAWGPSVRRELGPFATCDPGPDAARSWGRSVSGYVMLAKDEGLWPDHPPGRGAEGRRLLPRDRRLSFGRSAATVRRVTSGARRTGPAAQFRGR